MNKKSCVIYDSWGELLINLPDAMAGELTKLILTYAFTGKEISTDNPAIKAMFSMIRSKLDEDAQAYEDVKTQRSEAAKRRWADANACENMQTDANACGSMQKHANAYGSMQTDANACENMQTDAVSVSDSVSVSESPTETKERARTRKKFVKPSLDEVRAYCKDRNNSVDPEGFIDFYESKGWKVGNQPMKDWKACVRTWEKKDGRDRASPPAAGKGKIHDFTERKYDYAALETEAFGGSP